MGEVAEEAVQFDEIWYLDRYPDVLAAVSAGKFVSGFAHYAEFGRAEGRLPLPGREPPGAKIAATKSSSGFDAAWYEAAYPMAVREAGSNAPEALEAHFQEFGRFRGYLPNHSAPRPQNPAARSSAFGGLWLDDANARDVIAGRYEIGAIDKEDRDNLDEFVARGYAILRNVIPPIQLDRAEEALELAYSGGFPTFR